MYNTKTIENKMETDGLLMECLKLQRKEYSFLNGKPLIRAEVQPDSTATTVDDLKNDFNSLLQKLKYAGLMEME